jgi:hypothetical protein
VAAQEIVHRQPVSVAEARLALIGAWRLFHTEAGHALQRAISAADVDTASVLQAYTFAHNEQADDWEQGSIGMMWRMITER